MIFGESFERPPNTTGDQHACCNGTPNTTATPVLPAAYLIYSDDGNALLARASGSTKPDHSACCAVAGQSSYAWQPAISPSLSSRATSTEDTAHPFSGRASQKITIAAGAGTGSAGLANRGLGNEGLYFQQGKEYEGYFFASSPQSVTLQARIETTDGEILATQTIKHTPPSANATSYVQYNFSLIPSKGTEVYCARINQNQSVVACCYLLLSLVLLPECHAMPCYLSEVYGHSEVLVCMAVRRNSSEF